MLALVTVGSTEFSALIHAVLDQATLRLLQQRGYSRLLVQAGNSQLPAPWRMGSRAVDGLDVELVAFLPDLEERMQQADLIVCHAGPASVLRTRLSV